MYKKETNMERDKLSQGEFYTPSYWVDQGHNLLN
jgi:hypothetical protein